jgi:hypothetical protein
MTVEFSSLHKILKDPTRRTILKSLNDRGPLTYVELMKSADIDNTGRFNYHLKVLGALLEKQNDGRYVLSENGRLAVQLLDKFPDKDFKTKTQKKRLGGRRTSIAGIVIVAVVIVGLFVAVTFLGNTSPLFTVTGKKQPTESVGGGYVVTSWNFTFAYDGKNTLQNVNLYLNNGDNPFRTVPEVTKGWTDEYIWTPSDLNASVTITVSWQSGTEQYEFQP